MAARVYLSLNERPDVILEVMDRVEKQVQSSRNAQQAGCLASLLMVAGGVPFWLLDTLLGYNHMTFSLVSYFLWGAAIVLGVISIKRDSPKLNFRRYNGVRTIIRTLRDDIGRKGRLTGWLDLTGPRQSSKLVRRGRTRSGRVKYYYADPWFQFKAKLVDGNLLRVSIIERLKVKKGYVASRRMQLKARVAVNDAAYRGIRHPDPREAQQKLGLRNPRISVQDGIIELVADLPKKDPNPWQILRTLKFMYSHLEPRTAETGSA